MLDRESTPPLLHDLVLALFFKLTITSMPVVDSRGSCCGPSTCETGPTRTMRTLFTSKHSNTLLRGLYPTSIAVHSTLIFICVQAVLTRALAVCCPQAIALAEVA
uniref:Uncharacterized protein n=1 Tax=Rhipicephalus appendiculatus TaxID=34631 RepID=A0A131YA34_RHIAP